MPVVIVVVCAVVFFVSSVLVNKLVPSRCNSDCAHCPLTKEINEEN